MLPGLLLTEGTKRGLYLKFEEGAPFWIGRSETANFMIKHDPLISNLHCCLIRKGSQLALKDESTNGTKVNGCKVHNEIILLKNTDILVVGEWHFQVVDLEQASEESIKFDVDRCLKSYEQGKGNLDKTLHEIGPYLPIEVIGSGAVGIVYKAIHRDTKKLVALKILPSSRQVDPEFVQRFFREVRLLQKLEHPNIIQLFDHDTIQKQDERWSYIALEYFQGVDLHAHLKTYGPLSYPKVLKIFHQISKALVYMHEQGILHRDLKPHNILYNDIQELAKIVDLGFGKCIQQEERQTYFRTTTGSALGTPDFMPIEQWHYLKNVDVRADIYSLGATIYFLLAGEPPHGIQSDVISLYHAVLEKKMIPLEEKISKDLPKEALSLICRMLAFEAEERPASMKDVLNEVTQLSLKIQ